MWLYLCYWRSRFSVIGVQAAMVNIIHKKKGIIMIMINFIYIAFAKHRAERAFEKK